MPASISSSQRAPPDGLQFSSRLQWLYSALVMLVAVLLFAGEQTYREVADTHEDATQLAESLLEPDASLQQMQTALRAVLGRNELVIGARYCRDGQCIAVPSAEAAVSCSVSPYSLSSVCIRDGRRHESIDLRYSLKRAYRDAWMGIASLICILLGVGIAFYLATGRLRRRVRQAQRDLVCAATRDALTGLLNRSAFEVACAERIAQRVGSGGAAVLLYLDLDGLNEVNDRHGHTAGDQVLQQIGARLLEQADSDGLVGRLGGDEFGVLLALDEGAARLRSEALLKTLMLPVSVAGQTMPMGATIGAVTMAGEHIAFSEALRRADLALQTGRQTARGRVQWYQRALDDAFQQRYDLLTELRAAIDGGQLVLHYQPQIAMNGALCGVEALVRWNHPVRGVIRPDMFISLAEKSGLIGALGMKVFEMACADLLRCRQDGIVLPYISVNVSPLQLADPALVSQFEAALHKARLGPRDIELEVTESSLMGAGCVELGTVRRLAGMGFRIAIDDFGTGYSSLSRLHEMPVHKLKVDRAFVAPLPGQGHASAVADTILSLAHRFQLKTVAEGVETEAQAAWLKGAGCNLMQGFYFAKPMPLNVFQDWAWSKQNAELGVPTWADTAAFEEAPAAA